MQQPQQTPLLSPPTLPNPSSSTSRQITTIWRKTVSNHLHPLSSMWISRLKALRLITIILLLLNLIIIILGSVLVLASKCGGGTIAPFVVVVVSSGVRIVSMIGAGITQEATAAMIVGTPGESVAVDAVFRQERRMRYKRWLWWTRFGMIITLLQFIGATYLMFIIVKYVSYNGNSSGCFSGSGTDGNGWANLTLAFYVIMVWLLAILHCIAGSDVLRWRSFYATHDNAWRAHYQEVFDHGIREALCCLGRVKYLSVLEEDEVYSVARLLGDLVAYRASGTGHLELLAGLALLQRHRQSVNSYDGCMEAPEEQLREAVSLHKFAEAAYTETSDCIDPDVKQRVISSFPHYGHSGIVETARELFLQVDGHPVENNSIGFLTSLLCVGGECHGYKIRIVGHSLGGAIGALLGIRLYSRYPNLQVYSYGSLPCVDPIIAEACSDFVTSIVYRYEFSARLSVNSIMRLRAAAISALSQDPSADSALIYKLTQQIFNMSKCHKPKEDALSPSLRSIVMTAEDKDYHMYKRKYKQATAGAGEQDLAFPSSVTAESSENPNVAIMGKRIDEFDCHDIPSSFSVPLFNTMDVVSPCEDPVSYFLDDVSSSNESSNGYPPEVYIPGLVIHILPQKGSSLPLWKNWRVYDCEQNYKAYLVNRENFRDIIVSPYMFLDHLPWRCHYAMQKVLETKVQSHLDVCALV